jgi:hypothetical protein|tara:strand:+ start:482 stop:874 length:393 start_codon:yes stop_codon:yes gene_type:complete
MYGRAHTINNPMLKHFSFIFLFFLLLNNSHSESGSLSYQCKGISHFEILGTPGEKEEMKEVTYLFINGSLQDLNNIECSWESGQILCESNFLNIRKLMIDRKLLTVNDFISGNKGFGQYAEKFEGVCALK